MLKMKSIRGTIESTNTAASRSRNIELLIRWSNVVKMGTTSNSV
jgi:hypothetical protein